MAPDGGQGGPHGKATPGATRPLVCLCALAAGTRVALRCMRQQEFNADRSVIVFLLLVPSPVNYIATAGAFRCHSPVSGPRGGAPTRCLARPPRIPSAHCWCPGRPHLGQGGPGTGGGQCQAPPPCRSRGFCAEGLVPLAPQALPWGLPGWDPWAQLRHQPGNAPHGATTGPARGGRAGRGRSREQQARVPELTLGLPRDGGTCQPGTARSPEQLGSQSPPGPGLPSCASQGEIVTEILLIHPRKTRRHLFPKTPLA